MAPIKINGITVDPDDAADGTPSPFTSKDAATTNYIYIQCHEFRLETKQKDQLHDLGVRIVSIEGEAMYLCHYPQTSLEPVRNLPFIKHANAYHKVFKQTPKVKVLARTSEKFSTLIGLHYCSRSAIEVAEDVRKAGGVIERDVSGNGTTIWAELSKEVLPLVETIDDVKVGEFVPEISFFCAGDQSV